MPLRFRSLLALLAGGSLAIAAHAQDRAQGLFQYPSLTPDASHIVFSAGGDLWSVPVDGGAAYRLTSHPGIEGQSRFSGAGDRLVFESNRDGAQNLYTIEVSESGGFLVGGEIERITTSDRAQMLGGFDQSGERVLFSAYLYREIYRHPRMYSAALDGGPMERVTEAFGRAPATHPDTEDVYFIRGYYYPHRVAYRGPGNLDIWRYRPSDESFKQITAFDGNDFEPNPLPDGSVVYVSSRDGQYNLVRVDPDSTDSESVTQLTHFKPGGDDPESIAHGVRDLRVSADGSTAVFAVWNTMYTLDLTDARATPRAVEVSLPSDLAQGRVYQNNISRNVSEAAVHPSGKAVAQIARGELFVRSAEEDHPTRRISDSAFRERDIAWSPDGVRLYFTADDEQSLGSIYEATVSLAREDLEPEPVEPETEDEEVGTEPAVQEDTEAEDGAQADSPEGEEPTEDDEGSEDEKENEEKDEEPKIDYAKRWATALRFEIKPVVQSDELVFNPTPSPDGSKLLYLRERGDIVIRDLETGEERVVSEQWSEPDVQWASDSRHIVFAATDLDFNADIWLMDTESDDEGELREPVNLTRHPDIDHSPQLSYDGKVLTFLSDRDNENWEYDVYSIYLDLDLEGMAGYELAKYFEDQASAVKKLKPIEPVSFEEEVSEEEAADSDEAESEDAEDTADAEDDGAEEQEKPEPLEFDAEDAYLRVHRLTSTPESEGDLVMTPGGERVAFTTTIDGDRQFVSVDYKGRERKTIKSGGVGDPRVSLSGQAISFVSGGQASSAAPTGGEVTTYPLDAEITIDRDKELAQKFTEAAGRFGMSFYHPTMKGRDWQAITERYRDLAMQTRTNEAFLRVMDLMWGEVDGSHTGTRGGDGYSAGSPNTGYLGIDFTPVENGYRIDAVIDGGPIDRMSDGPRVGDVIVAVGDTDLADPGSSAGLIDLHMALAETAGDETLIEFIDNDEMADEASRRFGIVTPTSFGRASVLRYDDEVKKRRAEVEQLSGGKLGYLHIRGMGLAQVRDYERDLFAAADGKEGLVIDVRDNGGGWTTDILLASLTAPRHAYTVPRGADPEQVREDNYPRDRRLIYAYTRPISVLINEHSFSNAEIFAHSIRNTNRGKLVGKQTFGGVISTGSFSLIDGTTVRRPFRGWYLPDGTDMENNGAKPDIDVPQTPSDEAAGEDPQLRAAVEELLGRIDD